MQRLVLLRHGKAESVSDSGGDAERGLTDRGRRDSALIGRLLDEAGVRPDLALVSDARRARETWEEVSAAFPTAGLEIDRTLYLASAEHLAHTVDANGDNADCLIIVGHNPGLHELGCGYAGQSRGAARDALFAAFPTAAAAIFARTPEGSWVLEQMLTPREHGGGVH